MTLGIVLFVVAILVVIMVHELGHLLTAKLFGFKATQYFLGFGPTLWSTMRGETEYGVKALPLGGFVKIVGMNPYEKISEEDESRSYGSKPRWQRAIVLVAGSATHFLVAFLILLVTTMTLGFPTGKVTTTVASLAQSFGGSPTPAASAGLLPGDDIVGVDGIQQPSWAQLRSYIRGHAGKRTTFVVMRDGHMRQVPIALGKAAEGRDHQILAYAPAGESLHEPTSTHNVIGFLGVSPKPQYATQGLFGAVGKAGFLTWDTTRRSVAGIGAVFGNVFGGEFVNQLTSSSPQRNPSDGPLGIVGAGRIAGESVATGQYLELIALIVGFTVFVGLMNLLPLPPLDGGHLAVLAWEGITGRSVDLRKLIPIAAAVISFFVLLFVAVLYLDLARPVKLPF